MANFIPWNVLIPFSFHVRKGSATVPVQNKLRLVNCVRAGLATWVASGGALPLINSVDSRGSCVDDCTRCAGCMIEGDTCLTAPLSLFHTHTDTYALTHPHTHSPSLSLWTNLRDSAAHLDALRQKDVRSPPV